MDEHYNTPFSNFNAMTILIPNQVMYYFRYFLNVGVIEDDHNFSRVWIISRC